MNRKGVPAEMKDFKHREALSTEIYWGRDGPLSLTSYVVKTSSGKKNVMLLSTYPQVLGLTKDDGKDKSGLLKVYDFTKGGTDVVDQRMGFYTTKTKSRKWTRTALSYVSDMARVNSSTILSLGKKKDPTKVDSFEYCFNLAKQLITPYLEQRSLNGLGWVTRQKIQLVLGRPVAEQPPRLDEPGPSTSDTVSRSHVCISDNIGTGHKLNKDKMKRIQSLCQKCARNTCRQHLTQTCKICKTLCQ